MERITAWSLDGTTHVRFTHLIFSGGEPHVTLEFPHKLRDKRIWIEATVTSPEDFLVLAALADAIKACEPAWLGLFIPYFPGARQDRREKGRAFTAKVYAKMIQTMGFDKILCADVHSDVVPALLDVVNIPQHVILSQCLPYAWHNITGLISPDAGANKKIHKLAELWKLPVTECRKTRDPSNGQLSGFAVNSPLPNDGIQLVVDDICDGGGTFLGLADALQLPKEKLYLWVTHGIFSKGLASLETKFGKVFTTNSVCHGHDGFVRIFDIHEMAQQVFLGTLTV
jgi:ribose-phosphate pyrophosphokinase